MAHSTDHNELDSALRRCGSHWGSAQAHGLLCGRLAVHGADGAGSWRDQVLESLDPADALRAECEIMLDELFQRYERVGFKLLGVNIDDDSRKAMNMISELGVNFPVLFDSSKEVSKLYQVDAMPVTVIVDRDGKVRHVHQGYKPGYEDKYLDEIRSLLRE